MNIVFFNHKGGVSKTTTTFHLGWMLAERGSRVLVVDADPQCNLTSLIMQDGFDEYYTEDATKHLNIKDGVSSAFDGKPTPIEQIDCYNVPRNPNLFLLPGHPNLTELEPTLSFAQSAPGAFSTMQNLPGAFYALISKTKDYLNIDYVLIDLNPGLSAINQNLFSISDIFIIPTNPDPFSLMAISTLSKVLPRWFRAANEWKNTFQNSTYPFPDKNPKLGGVIIQRYNIRKGKPATPFRNTMNEILNEVRNGLVPALTSAGMTYPLAIYQQAEMGDNYSLGEIPDFQSLQQQSQLHGVPVYALEENEMGFGGVVLDQMVEKKNQFFARFTELALKIEYLKLNG
ncbi:ParA family protein [Pedobacter sp. UBA5917]|jgi:cellulose biosynthesis protein BcsQ|uniref:ParA family protein n=1 Tax=Pedobacter sp. UBA5917 TaxID=1947061 RepID=UPI0025DCADA8|nr:ParA family protein [Pedobacter sp. UBA5917]